VNDNIKQDKIVIIGPAYPLRGGGMATFNERMAQEFMSQHFDTTIYTFSLQYPSFLFPGKSQYSNDAAPPNLKIKVCINSINPFNWIKVGLALKKLKPEKIIVRYWLPFMGPCLGTILRLVKLNKYTRVICIADNVVPHEKKIIDKPFTSYFLKPIDAFVTMSDKVMSDLRLFTQKKATKVLHPLYDNFGSAISKSEAQSNLNINPSKKTLLFFGFIRQYKGLDILYNAIKLIKDNNIELYNNIQLVVAGEYYDNEKNYTSLIDKLQIGDVVIQKTNFISNDEVKNYFCATDVVIQPYRNATQSGVTPLAYHFNKPMIVTNVGGLASNVPHQKVGYVCEPNAQSIADAIEAFFKLDQQALIDNIQLEKKKYSWKELIDIILHL
jgi:glycosyltransferase involved in cell wall biosynthesis